MNEYMIMIETLEMKLLREKKKPILMLHPVGDARANSFGHGH